jgi:hypothetical protein
MTNVVSRSKKSMLLCAMSHGLAMLFFYCAGASAQFPQNNEVPATAAINQHPKTALNPSRLWLPPQQAKVAGLLLTAANRALEHPECAEVLYGGLNEFRTEREGTSFTIMCIKDARTTFNQVFHERDLVASEVRSPAEEAAARAEIERLRGLIQNPSGQGGAQTPGQLQRQQQQAPQQTQENQAAPTVF